MRLSVFFLLTGLSGLLITGCATEKSTVLPVEKVTQTGEYPAGPKLKVALGNFDNRSTFQRGVFSDGVDRLGNQAKTILTTHMQQSRRFSVMDRANMEALQTEVGFQGTAQNVKGADFVVTGAVTEFGRKTVGDQQLFGIAGKGKSQVAYAKVALNVVDVRTSEVVYSGQGAGEYSLSEREVLGFGSTASYDSTLNGKVLDLAMREAIIDLISEMDARPLPQ